MKIVSLNVNNFGGAAAEKPRRNRYTNWDTYVHERNNFQEGGDRVTCAEKIAERLKAHDPDVIILSEFDIAAPAGERFIMLKSFAGDFKMIVPDVYYDKNGKITKTFKSVKDYGPGHSITVIFVKKALCGKGTLRETAPGGWADFNLIRLGDVAILGVHAKEKNFGTLREWSMKAVGEAQRVLIIGDFNTWADNVRCPETREAYREILDRGYTDMCPEGVPTFIGGTCIDHALIFSGLAGESRPAEGTVDRSFIDEGMSDHAAVIVEIE